VKAAQFNLALSYKALGKSDMAQFAYEKYIAAAGPADAAAQSAYWEIFAIQKDRKDYPGALSTLEKLRDLGSEASVEATYRTGEIYSAMGRPDEAMNSWERLRGMKPAKSPFRLQGLIKLGEIYEKSSDWLGAISAYDDLARNASREIAQTAAQRAAALRRLHGGGAGARPPAGGEAQEETPAPAPKARRREKRPKAKKAPAKAAAQSEKPAPKPKPPQLPGMGAGEEIK
jgi:tetratricopeptide (TPR) repeat protein